MDREDSKKEYYLNGKIKKIDDKDNNDSNDSIYSDLFSTETVYNSSQCDSEFEPEFTEYIEEQRRKNESISSEEIIETKRSFFKTFYTKSSYWFYRKCIAVKNGIKYGFFGIKNCFRYTFCCLIRNKSRPKGIIKSVHVN